MLEVTLSGDWKVVSLLAYAEQDSDPEMPLAGVAEPVRLGTLAEMPVTKLALFAAIETVLGDAIVNVAVVFVPDV